MAKLHVNYPSSEPDDYEARQDVRAVARAHAVKSNPERHKRMKHHAKKMLKESQADKQRALDQAKESQHAINLGQE